MSNQQTVSADPDPLQGLDPAVALNAVLVKTGPVMLTRADLEGASDFAPFAVAHSALGAVSLQVVRRPS